MIRFRVGLGLLLGGLGLLACACSEDEATVPSQTGGAGQGNSGQSGQSGEAGTSSGGQAGAAGAPSGGQAGAGGASQGGQAGEAGSGGANPEDLHIVMASFTQSPTVPLAGTLSVTLDRAARVRVTVDDGQGHAFALDTKETKTQHAIPVIQVRPGRTYKLGITATDEAGHSATTSVDRPTAPLPADFPPIEVVAADPARPGLTLFPVGRFSAQGADNAWAYVVALDAAGQVVWYVHSTIDLSDVRLTSKGDLRLMTGEKGIVEATALGEPIRALLASNLEKDPVPDGILPVALDTIHHDTVELPSGNLLALSTEARKIPKSQCATYDQDYTVVSDVMAEIDPATGAVVQNVSMFDLIDPCRRVDASFKSAFWTLLYGAGAADWTHANSVFHDAPGNRVLVSARHQDWVVFYRHAADANGPAGELLYKFGVDGDFTLTGQDAQFPYHQHSAKIVSNGHLMLFDNGITRPGTSDTDITKLPRSRAVEYELKMEGPKASWQAAQVWEFGSKDVRLVDTSTGSPVEVGYYSPVVSDADLTADDTVLMTNGCLTTPANGNFFLPTVKKWARIVEVSHDADPKVILDLRIEDKADTDFKSYLVYRAERIGTLYPPSSPVEVTAP